ncbi:MAG: polysaccharide biosynthesis C-terminal domain-containing protein [Clostridia bacterium]|nr:polysaccharide biosynthesis C-terminal domain-containing protein [Clostridia bacterium]
MGEAKAKKPIDLGNAKIGRLILTFAIPSILSHLVASIYNIVDQIFIGQNIGTEGTAASQVAYMLVLFMTACYVLISTGAASKFSLEQGEGESKEKQGKVVGNGFFWLIAVGIVLMVIVLIFKEPLLKLFGARDNEAVLSYACDYTWIIAIGMPFQMFAAGGAIIIRADGSPTYSMMTTLSGAILNIGLDALFMMVFGWGIQGAALATIIGQIVSAIICFAYFFKFKTIKFKAKYILPNGEATGQIFRLGLAAGLMQFAIMIVQTIMNNMLSKYGESDLVNVVTENNMTVPEEYLVNGVATEAAIVSYSSATALAVAGVVAKVNSIFNATIYGIATSVQPVLGYNYGAKRYHRVLKTFLEVVVIALIVGLVAFTLFQVIPRPILHIFQSGDDLYDEFGTQYLRIFMGAVFLTAIPITVSNFFPSINMPIRGIIASISRQIIFQLPLILILPIFFGMDGVLYAGCSADSAACLLCIILVLPTVVKLARAPKDPDIIPEQANGEPALAAAAAGADGSSVTPADNTTDNVLYDASCASLSSEPVSESPADEDPFAIDADLSGAPAEGTPAEEHPLVAEESAYQALAGVQLEETSAEEVPAEKSAEDTLAEEVPATESTEDVPAEEPVEEVPADETSAEEEITVEEVPADESVQAEVSEEEVPAAESTEEVSADEAPAEEPVQVEVPEEDVSVDESFQDEVPADEVPAAEEEITVEEVSAAESTEDVPAEKPVEETPAEEVSADEAEAEADAAEDAPEGAEDTDTDTDSSADHTADADVPVVEEAAEGEPHKYDFSFIAKVIQSPDEVRERYAEVVNYFQTFKGTNTRVSWKQCGMTYGKTRVGLMQFRGKTLTIALALDPAEFEGTKYHGRNMGGRKKFAKTPMMLSLTSGRKLIYVKHLINVMMDRLGASKGGKTADVSYKYQTTEELVEQGLAKDLTAAAETVTPAQGEE